MQKCLIISFDFSKEKDGYPPISYSVASILAKFNKSDFIEIVSYSCDMNDFLNTSGISAEEIETRIHERFRNKFIESIKDYSFIALSAYAWSENLVNAFVKMLRPIFAGKIILGGYEITALKEELLLKTYPDVDYYIKGYAEKTLEKIFKNTISEKILNEQHRDEDLVSPYLSETLPLTTKNIYWESKRGCPYKCDFCEWGNAGNGKIIRINSERIDREIALFKQKNIQQINVLDATFLLDDDDIITLEKLLEIPRCDISLQVHFDPLKKDHLKNKFFALCQNHRGRISLEFGLQSIHKNEMEVLGRKNDIEHIKTMMEELNRRNIRYEITIIFGIPGQTVASFEDTIKFIEENGCKEFRAFPLRLPQNSKMKERTKELKIKESQSRDELYSLQVVTESYSFTYSDWEKMYSIANKYNKKKTINERSDKAVVPIIDKAVYSYFMGGLRNVIDSNAYINILSDKKIKEKLRSRIVEYLQNNDALDNFTLFNFGIDNYIDTVKIILSNNVMLELCTKDISLAEHITEDIFEFINKTKRHIRETDNPFEYEYKLLDEFKATEVENFEKAWEITVPFVREKYNPYVFDTEFYYGEFQKSLSTTKDERNRISFQSVKEHFTDKWDGLLFQKKLKWELDIIEEQRKEFCEKLYEQIARLKKLQELIGPFMSELGRLWDMSTGRWQKVNFNIMEKYAKRLEQDTSLQELAEMLGRMRQAEREYEEELFAEMVVKPTWKIEHAAKSELVGIHESDDISSMLPAEAALLADEKTELLFYKKFAEKKLQTFEYQAKTLSTKEEVFQNKRQKAKENKKGPIIICVDTSGSMHGTPEQVAKTLSFALLKIAIGDNRKCYLISFSTGIETLELTDMRNNLEKLLDFLSMSFCGGTDGVPAMNAALQMLETEAYKKADVVMASDGIMPPFDDVTQQKILLAKNNKTKFHSLIIGGSANQQVIKEFDNNWRYNSDDPRRAVTLVKNIRQGLTQSPTNIHPI